MTDEQYEEVCRRLTALEDKVESVSIKADKARTYLDKFAEKLL